MKKFEYQIIYYERGFEKGARDKFLAFLNKLGQEGWELAFEKENPSPSVYVELTFKREI